MPETYLAERVLCIEDSSVISELTLFELTFNHALDPKVVAINSTEVLVLNPGLEFFLWHERSLAIETYVFIHYDSPKSIDKVFYFRESQKRWLFINWFWFYCCIRFWSQLVWTTIFVWRLVKFLFFLDLVLVLLLLLWLYLAGQHFLGCGTHAWCPIGVYLWLIGTLFG